MPTYEYRCADGHAFEVFQRMSDEPVGTCPQCGKQAERLLSGGAGLIFKGDGFYITETRSEDYKKKQSAESAASESAEPTKPASSEAASSKSSATDTATSTTAAKPTTSDTD